MGFYSELRHLFVAMYFCWVNPCFSILHFFTCHPYFFVPHVWAWQILVAVCRFFCIGLFIPKFRLIPMACFILLSSMWQRDPTGVREGLLDGCDKLRLFSRFLLHPYSFFCRCCWKTLWHRSFMCAGRLCPCLPGSLGSYWAYIVGRGDKSISNFRCLTIHVYVS